MGSFLRATEVMDWEKPAVLAKAKELAGGGKNVEKVVRRCFEWVRDEIKHTGDWGLCELTCAASEVLAAGSGFCYAKSHLLAGLLRANGIPAGLCYQRLCIDEEDEEVRGRETRAQRGGAGSGDPRTTGHSGTAGQASSGTRGGFACTG